MLRNKLLVLVLGILFSTCSVWAATEGPNIPGTMANDTGIGTEAWSNVDNVKVSDDSDATNSLASGLGPSNYLKATNFGFSIASGSTIDGIVVEWEKDGVGASIEDEAIRIVKAGTIKTEDKSVVGDWPNGDTYISYGSSSDLWGETWTVDDINATGFGAALSAKSGTGMPAAVNVDNVRITVHFTTGAAVKKGAVIGPIMAFID